MTFCASIHNIARAQTFKDLRIMATQVQEALTTMQVAVSRRQVGVSVATFTRLVGLWEVAENNQPHIAGLMLPRNPPCKASYSTQRSTSRPMLRHRRPFKQGSHFEVAPRHRPVEELQEGKPPAGITYPACQLGRSREHYSHTQGRKLHVA